MEQQLYQKDFDPMHFIKQQFQNKFANENASTQDQIEEQLKVINHLNFKLQMQSSECENLLSHSTKIILNEISNVNKNQLKEQIPQLNEISTLKIDNYEKKQEIKNEFLQLIQTNQRIERSKKMSQEIEHFESRIAKVEDYIRQDKFIELTQLIQQIQESLKVVRDLSFFEKQKQRIERFDKIILEYLQDKEKKLVFEQQFYRTKTQEIKSLVVLELYFERENTFIDQLIDQKLIRDFESQLNKQVQDQESYEVEEKYEQRLFPHFKQACILYLSNTHQFLDEVFSIQQSKNLKKIVYEKLLNRIINDYKEKLISEFTHSLAFDQQIEVYELYYIETINQIKELVPTQIDFTSNLFLLMNDLYIELNNKYKREIDYAISNSYESIIEKEDLVSWERNFEKVLYIFEKVLVNNIEICQCFELASLITQEQKAIEKFMMQLCYHISQYSSKKVHLGAPNPNSSFNSLHSLSGFDDQQYTLYEEKFKWQNIFDYITLHNHLMSLYYQFKQLNNSIDTSLAKLVNQFELDSIQKKVSACIAQKNTQYFKQLQKYVSPNTQNLLFQDAKKNLEQEVFKLELLEESIKGNLMRTFIMPIFKELNNINIFALWKQSNYNIPTNPKNTQKQKSLLLPEPGEYIRKIGDHFISFIHKLDSSQIPIECDQKLYLYNKFCNESVDSSSSYWIGEIGNYLIQNISNKYMKINMLSPDGEKQLISDIIYFKKLVQQFCNLETPAFQTFDSILIGLFVQKKINESIDELLSNDTVDTNIKQICGVNDVRDLIINEQIVRAVLTKRK